jgi:catecholate siderophore receptor
MKVASSPDRSPRPRKRGTSRLFVLGATFAAVGSGVAHGQSPARPATTAPVTGAQTTAAVRFDIPAGMMRDVVRRYTEVTGVRVTMANDRLGALQSPGVSGTMTAQQALDQLLNGIGVAYVFTSPNAVTLEIKQLSESIAVAGSDVPRTLQSPKYRDELRDTPQEVVVIPQRIFEEQSATSLREVLRNTPGITMSIGEGASGTVSFGDNIFIRGFNVRNDIYIDGARDPGEIVRDTFNVEAVEVAKGPTSVTGGRGSTGGSINMVSKAATLTDSASGRMTLGNADHRRTSFDVNRKLTDSIAFRLNGMWQDAGYPGRDVQKNKGWGIAPTLGIGIGKPTNVTVSYSRTKQNNVPDLGIPTLLPDNAINAGVTVNDLDFSNYYSIASRDYEHTTSDVVTGIVQHQFNRMFTLRNLTRYGNNYRDAVSTPPRPVTTAANQGTTDPGYDPTAFQMRRTDTKYQHRTDRVTTNQTDLTSQFNTGRVSHSADIGLEVAADRQPTYAFADTFGNGRPPVIDLLHPDPFVVYTPTYAKTGATSNADANSAAIYVFDTVHFNEHFQADLGVRYDHVKIDYETVSATGVVANFGRTDKATTGRAGLVYKPVEKGSIYTAFSTSFAPVYDSTHGLALAATGATGQALGPEKSRNFEIGTKWDLAEGLHVTAAYFNLEKTDAKTTDLAGAVSLLGDQEINGVEFTAAGTILPRWNAYGGLSLMHGEVKKSATLSEEGVILPYVPKAMLNLWTTYELPMRLTVGGGVNYSDGNFFNQTGTFNFVAGGTVSQPKYATNAAAIQALTKYLVFNAMASYPVNPHLTLQVNLNNIGDEKYADRGYDRHFMPGPARQILFSPVISF